MNFALNSINGKKKKLDICEINVKVEKLIQIKMREKTLSEMSSVFFYKKIDIFTQVSNHDRSESAN